MSKSQFHCHAIKCYACNSKENKSEKYNNTNALKQKIQTQAPKGAGHRSLSQAPVLWQISMSVRLQPQSSVAAALLPHLCFTKRTLLILFKGQKKV